MLFKKFPVLEHCAHGIHKEQEMKVVAENFFICKTLQKKSNLQYFPQLHTCADTLCQSYVKECSRVAGAAAEFRENVKNSHYKELAGDYCFFPIAVETFGSWGSESHKLVKEIGKKVMEETGEKRSSFYLFQSISIAIQRGNASCVLGTIPHTEGLEEIFDLVTYGDGS